MLMYFWLSLSMKTLCSWENSSKYYMCEYYFIISCTVWNGILFHFIESHCLKNFIAQVKPNEFTENEEIKRNN